MSMMKFEKVNKYNCYILKGLQIILFTYLFCQLTINLFRKKGSIGGLPVIVSFFTILNGVFDVNRTVLITREHTFME